MTTRAQQSSGWMADLSLGFKLIEGKTVLSHRERKGPLAVQRSFYPEGGVCHVYVLHPPGGVVGGDTQTLKTHHAAQAEALITTPCATKFYRSAGSVAKQIQILSLSTQACLEWFRRRIFISLAPMLQLKTE